MPDLRPFRALRFDASSVGDIGAVVAPPYDVIDEATRARLVERHPANVVRLDFPVEAAGDEPDDRYRRAAKTLAAWRSDGTLRKDPHPSIYVYEQAYRVPGTDGERTQRGFFARLKLESFGPDAGVLPHERTLSAPKEDRYKLLRATGVNTSPVVACSTIPADGRSGWRWSPQGRLTPTSSTTTACAIACGRCPRRAMARRAPSPASCSRPPNAARSRSPMATIATRPRCAIATSAA